MHFLTSQAGTPNDKLSHRMQNKTKRCTTIITHIHKLILIYTNIYIYIYIQILKQNTTYANYINYMLDNHTLYQQKQTIHVKPIISVADIHNLYALNKKGQHTRVDSPRAKIRELPHSSVKICVPLRICRCPLRRIRRFNSLQPRHYSVSSTMSPTP
jgi:hypothetical protein